MPAIGPCRRPEIAWRVIDGEAVVVNPRSGLVYPFNPVATRFWELADGTREIEQIIEQILEEFEAPHEDIERDIAEFLQMLVERGMIALPA